MPLTTALLAGALILAQANPAPEAAGIAACDRYFRMVEECIPRMCETEAMLVEVELAFSREIIAKIAEDKGNAAATEQCLKDIRAVVVEDVHGCYESERAAHGVAPAPIQDVELRPSAKSVRMTFRSAQPPATPDDSNAPWTVAIGMSELEEPQAEYLVSAAGGVFVLDTASALPVPVRGTAAAEATPAPLVLEPDVSYCFVIRSPSGAERKGTFAAVSESSRR